MRGEKTRVHEYSAFFKVILMHIVHIITVKTNNSSEHEREQRLKWITTLHTWSGFLLAPLYWFNHTPHKRIPKIKSMWLKTLKKHVDWFITTQSHLTASFWSAKLSFCESVIPTMTPPPYHPFYWQGQPRGIWFLTWLSPNYKIHMGKPEDIIHNTLSLI